MFIVLHAKRILCIIGLTILFLGGMMIISYRTLVPVFRPAPTDIAVSMVYIIDAGHGGEDGGAVSASGVTESTLNLEIAQRLNDVLSFLGKDTVMTRPGGKAVYSAGASTLREKKRSDLQNRVEMVNGYDGAVLLSIHQNSLPSVPSVHGAQTFYNTVSGADQLAEQIQQSLNQTVNAGNEKTEKRIDDTIYLMRQVLCPAVLVECGFLSNAEETKLLQERQYQTRLALTIAAGVLQEPPEEARMNTQQNTEENKKENGAVIS